jgi:RNA-directed DNA polymerase
MRTDHEPQSAREWEQWIKVVRSAIRRQAITADQRPATTDDPAASRLVHTHCTRKNAKHNERAQDPAAEPGGSFGLA